MGTSYPRCLWSPHIQGVVNHSGLVINHRLLDCRMQFYFMCSSIFNNIGFVVLQTVQVAQMATSGADELKIIVPTEDSSPKWTSFTDFEQVMHGRYHSIVNSRVELWRGQCV